MLRISVVIPAIAALLVTCLAGAQTLPEPELGDRLINQPTHLTVGYGSLQLLFTHRFSETVDQGGFTSLGGLDSAADVGIGLTLGFADRWQAELYRSSFFKEWELAVKWSMARQGDGMPVGLALRAGGAYRAAKGITNRGTGFVQGVLSRRISSSVDLFVIPVWVSDTPTLRNAFNAPVAASVHLPHSWDLVLELVPGNKDAENSELAWAIGLNKRIRGHAFLLYLGNSRATTTDLIAGSDLPGGFGASDVRLGFNLIRRFPE